MSDFFCDVSAIGNEYQAWADTPATWGVPQDGNGKAGPGHSAAVAIWTLDCTSAQGDGAQSLSILGVTVSNTSSASGATLAASLVTSINGTSTAVADTYSKATLPLNRLVFARQKPDETAKVQVMMRVAGTDWNSDTPTHAGFTTGPSISLTQSGANGPFAYVVTGDTSPFGKTKFAYGTWMASSAGKTDPGASDVIYYRSKRSGSNLTVNCTWGDYFYGGFPNRNHVYDNGTIWSGDNGTLSVYLTQTQSGGYKYLQLLGSTWSHASIGYRNLDIIWKTSGAEASDFQFGNASDSGGCISFVRVGILEHPGGSGSFLIITKRGGDYANSHVINLIDCYIWQKATIKTRVCSIDGSYNNKFRICLNGSKWIVSAASGTLGNILSAGNQQNIYAEWIGGEITDTNNVYFCADPFSVSGGGDSQRFFIENVKGISDFSIPFFSGFGVSELVWNSAEGSTKAFRHQTAQFIVDWKGNGSFPYYNAQNLKGDYWSQRVTWNSVPGYNKPILPLKQSLFYRDTAATRTLTMELYVPDATTIYRDEISLAVSYTDSGNVARVEYLSGTLVSGIDKGAQTRTALAASSAVWQNGIAAHSAKKLEITTAYPIQQNSEVTVRLMLAASRSPNVVFYVSPLLGVA